LETSIFLQYAVILMLAAVIAVPLAKRWQLGAVLGYLGAGVLIGPSVLGLLGTTEEIASVADLGVVLMLFVIGLEVSPQRLWVMRRRVFGLGSLQMGVSALLIGAIAAGFGLHWKAALVVGLGLALSSTAIALQILAERKELGQAYGRHAFAILLFQDVAAIPLLALVPVLGLSRMQPDFSHTAMVGLRDIALIAAIVVGGRYLLRPLFRAAAKTHIPEVFTASALLVVMGTAWIMGEAGMSMSLGAFLAGVLLADSEYRPEIEAQIDPFKGLLLGLFFISIGMGLDLDLVVEHPLRVASLLALLIAIKAGVLYLLSRLVAGEDRAQSLSLAALLAQGGEFAFVVFALARDSGLIGGAERDLLILVVTLSMAATPLLVFARAHFTPAGTAKKRAREYDPIDDARQQPRVIIAGFGRFGQIVGRILHAHRIPFTALETDSDQVEFIRRFGHDVYYGDATRLDLLRAAHTDRAEVFIVATENTDTNLRTARLLKRHFPHLNVFARARHRQHVFKLMDLSVDRAVRETFFSSLEVARSTLEALGFEPEAAADSIRRFREHDEKVLAAQYPFYDDEAALLQSANEARADLERLFEADKPG
jgi:glutathione-regulated potassium-efflux system protein KefB